MKVHTLLDGLRFTEGPRWHDGALWFSDMHDHRVLRVTPDGAASTVVEIYDDEPSGLGWLPDGRLLVVAMETQRLLRVEPDGSIATHADLSSAARGDLNDMIVAESGGACLTAFDVAADGTLSGRRPFAALTTPVAGRPAVADGICLDAEGAVWYADPLGGFVARVREGGEVTDRIPCDGVIPVACVLGGPERRTLYMCVAAHWRRSELADKRTARIDEVHVDVPGAGRP